MLSHEVKNYALLGHDGRLMVRRNALQSSRTEPFGVRFLDAALRCLLVGDTAGVHRVYRDTVAALRERRLAPVEVATLSRLTKTPQAYAASRARAREAAYEALLAAGRTRWRRGERVRHYRAADGTAVWLPRASGDDGRPTPESSAGGRGGRELPPYDVAHYLAVLHTSYVARLRKAFAPDDFAQLFRPSGQAGLFDRPLTDIAPQWIRTDRSRAGA